MQGDHSMGSGLGNGQWGEQDEERELDGGKRASCARLGQAEVGAGPLEKGKATHSSVLAWRIPQTIPMGLLRFQDGLEGVATRWPGGEEGIVGSQ